MSNNKTQKYSGIYAYIDKKTGEIVYIGKDSHIYKNSRNKAHFSKSKYDEQPINRILQNNPNRYEYKVLYMGNFDQELLNMLEVNSIAEHNPMFNFTDGGDGTLGYNHSEEAKSKISDAMKGQQHFLGHKHTQETKNQMAESKKGDKNPMKNPETAKKVSEALTGRRGSETNMWGKHHTKETRTQISKKKSRQQNTTGYYRVRKAKTNSCKQGFYYRYRYYDDNGKRKEISSVDIKKLEEKVKKAGLEWMKFD